MNILSWFTNDEETLPEVDNPSKPIPSDAKRLTINSHRKPKLHKLPSNDTSFDMVTIEGQLKGVHKNQGNVQDSLRQIQSTEDGIENVEDLPKVDSRLSSDSRLEEHKLQSDSVNESRTWTAKLHKESNVENDGDTCLANDYAENHFCAATSSSSLRPTMTLSTTKIASQEALVQNRADKTLKEKIANRADETLKAKVENPADETLKEADENRADETLKEAVENRAEKPLNIENDFDNRMVTIGNGDTVTMKDKHINTENASANRIVICNHVTKEEIKPTSIAELQNDGKTDFDAHNSDFKYTGSSQNTMQRIWGLAQIAMMMSVPVLLCLITFTLEGRNAKHWNPNQFIG